ncbi:MAG: UDP-N-acetylmuramate--L-alanine ligase [Halanaerobiales bacterium]|nr:UDP-N-acetylmuramate--L-alanine ligase [Halanaerobiales bacterium]
MDTKKIHFIGIGGISMSGIASILLDLGFEVSGSDLKDSPLLRDLEKKGAQVFVGHDEVNLKNPDEVVVTAAIPPTNVELMKARELGIPIVKRAQMIARLMNYKKGIAIAGTHGKTTTTSMVSLLLDKIGLDPTVLIGGELNDIGGNAKLGQGEYLITEADESDGSFLYFEPLVSVVTNIESDHMDYYGTEENLKDTFIKFLEKVPSNGVKIVCWDDPVIRSLVNADDANLMTYGSRDDCVVQMKDTKFFPQHTEVEVYYKGSLQGQLILQVPGLHNVYNSLAAVAVGFYLGYSFDEIAQYLGQFKGVHRRFEKKGLVNDVLVVDDYAHHPTEIKMSLKAAKQRGKNRVIAIFQPHRYSRTLHLKDDFSKSFSDADTIIMTGIYSAGEKPIKGVDGHDLAQLTEQYENRPVKYFSNLEGIAEYLSDIVQPGDLVITLGAGDIYQVGEELLKILSGSGLSLRIT